MAVTIRSPESDEDYARYYALRWKLLREPWGQPRGSEKDEFEDRSYHLMAVVNDNIPVAIARIHFTTPARTRIRYMAVEPVYQGQHIGSNLLGRLEAHAQAHGATTIVLHARQHSVGFYRRADYQVIGVSHTLFGTIPHVEMHKNMAGNPDQTS